DSLIRWVQQLPQTFPGFTFLSYQVDLTPFYREVALELARPETQSLLPSATNLANIVRDVITSTMQVVSFATVVATSVIGRFLGSLISGLLLILLTFYIANDLPKIGARVESFAPPAYQAEWRELWRRTGVIWNAFFRGQIILSASVGVAVWLGLSIIGVPGALALGVLSGVLEVIPNLGPVLAALPALLLALLQGSTNYPETSHLTIMLVTIVFYIGIQQVENLFLVPRILGQSVGIHPALVLVGVAAFTFQFGILGAFVATPTIATLQLWFSYFHARILLQEPFPLAISPEPEPQAQAPPEGEELTEDQEAPAAIAEATTQTTAAAHPSPWTGEVTIARTKPGEEAGALPAKE
ncbi:MAG: AI-2E family transporter, partial [Caldilineae bacterium]